MNLRHQYLRKKLLLFLLLQKNLSGGEVADKLSEKEEETEKFKGIRCPDCAWQPTGSSRWQCCDCAIPEHFRGGCGTSWNTFATAGLCPGCLHRWRWTMCLACGVWNLHKDWYVEDKEQ